VLHGHHHNNHPKELPFLALEEKLFNLSGELTNYGPVSLSTVVDLIDRDERLKVILNSADPE
jgi:calcineurin-like phosphoesterase family protein